MILQGRKLDVKGRMDVGNLLAQGSGVVGKISLMHQALVSLQKVSREGEECFLYPWGDWVGLCEKKAAL